MRQKCAGFDHDPQPRMGRCRSDCGIISADIVGAADLWHQYGIGARQSCSLEIVFCPRRAKAIDADHHFAWSKPALAKRRYRSGAGFSLGLGRNRIFQIEHHHIGGQRARLGHGFRI